MIGTRRGWYTWLHQYVERRWNEAFSLVLYFAESIYMISLKKMFFVGALFVAFGGVEAIAAEPYDFENDPIGKALYGKIPAYAENAVERYKRFRRYSTDDFPMKPEAYAVYREEVRRALINSMTGPSGKGEDWLVMDASKKGSHVLEKFDVEPIETVDVHDSDVELYKMTIHETGDVIPFGMCAPKKTPAPAVILFSGHTAEGGLRELFVDRDSYQKAMALRLCEQGFVTLALEKPDSGVSTMHFQHRGERWEREDEPGGGADDEFETASTFLAIGDYLIPGRQLMANIAALEFLAADERVDHNHIGAAGVSLGGWLTLHTALVNSRIKAVANFGGMWAYIDDTLESGKFERFEGVNDYSQLIPGIWRLGDQNRFILAAAPLVMITGYGELDYPYTEYEGFFFPVVPQQYEALGASENIEVIRHEQGHTFPVKEVIGFFSRRLSEKHSHQ